MNTFASVVGEVEAAVASGDGPRRVATLRAMTDLFVGAAPSLADAHVDVFDEIILRLARDLEFRARMELSERFAGIGNAPQRVVGDLARDPKIEVAGPVLERSIRLSDEDLLEIAKDRGQDHLLALSRRRSLSERVTDVLVDRGNEIVVRSVAGNDGARFSGHGYEQLLEKARADEGLQGILTTRRDIPPQHMVRLVEIARERTRERLQGEFGDGATELVDDAVDQAARAAAAKGSARLLDSDIEAARTALARRLGGAAPTEALVGACLQEGAVAEAVLALAQVAAMPVDVVVKAFHATHYDPLLFIVRSIKFGWGTFKLLLAAKAGRQPPADVMRNAFDSFQQLTVQTAQRVVRFTAVRERVTQPSAA